MNNSHMTQAQKDAVNGLIQNVGLALQPFMRNLTPEENVRVGSIKEQEKLFVNKVLDYHQSMPELDSPDVDWAEFEADHETRRFYELTALRLITLANMLTETRRLHDYDNYQNGLIDYDHAKYKDRLQQGSGYDIKVAELGQFFTGGGPGVPTEDNP